MKQEGLNGGESDSTGDWTPTQAVSCSLESIVDEAVELLTLIDQPSYWNEETV